MVELLPPDRRIRLTRLLGMLGSAHMGERAVAAAKADELVRDAGLTWNDIVAVTDSAHAKEARSAPEHPWQEMAGKILGSGCYVTQWERDFCESLLERWHGPCLTAKQEATLTRIFAQRVERYAR